MLPFLKAADGRIPNLAGIKYTYESLYEYNQCMLYENGKFDMLHGQDETILSALIMGGAKGGISGTGSYIGKTLVSVIDEYNKGNIAEAVDHQNFAQEVINVIARYRGNIVAGKRIMKFLGIDLGINRTPFQNVTSEEEAIIRKELEAIGFFERCNKL
jgi:N-acetylneuraminate lyase